MTNKITFRKEADDLVLVLRNDEVITGYDWEGCECALVIRKEGTKWVAKTGDVQTYMPSSLNDVKRWLRFFYAS